MQYKITASRTIEDTLYTDVDFDFDGTNVSCSIAHFRPQSLADVEDGILNRSISEQDKLQAAAVVAQVAQEIRVDVAEDLTALNARVHG